jgi:hypothetical protein
MKAQSLVWHPQQKWAKPKADVADAQLVVLMGSRECLEASTCLADLRDKFPRAYVIGCSTGGQIIKRDVTDGTAIALAMKFAHAKLRFARETITDPTQSHSVGHRIGCALSAPDLKSVLVVSNGLCVNGSRLVSGLCSGLGEDIIITGGLAGDGASFIKTVVVADGQLGSNQVAAVGFYGHGMIVGHGSAGGWDAFGPRRVITSSEGNTLHRLDDRPALELYKQYLGDEAEGLPGTALLYPLMISDPENRAHAVVRTVLSVDHDLNSMTFAGDIPEGWTAQLMRGQFDNLSAGAAQAGHAAAIKQSVGNSDIAAILISCIGRRLLMGESIVDEIEAAIDTLGAPTACIGFYSYGEISPHPQTGACELHNQTMTITTLAEIE